MDPNYCIYKNKIVERISPEHIIPLSLGGCDKFCINVDRTLNSEFGSAIDGKMANSYLMLEIRQQKKYYGHSKKAAKAIIKNASLGDTEQPVQAHIESILNPDKEGNITVLHTYSPKERRALIFEETSGKRLRLPFIIDMTLEMAFVAKVILAAGYFVFGDDFIRYTDHDYLRNHVRWYMAGANPDDENHPDRKNDGAASCHRMILVLDSQGLHHPIPTELLGIYQSLAMVCQIIDNSCVLFHIRATQLICTVGIGGLYIGTIGIKADVLKLAERHKDIMIYVKNGHINTTTHNELIAAYNSKNGL